MRANPSSLHSPIRRRWRAVAAALPKGRGLDEEMWARRHRVIVGVLWLVAAGLTGFGIGATAFMSTLTQPPDSAVGSG